MFFVVVGKYCWDCGGRISVHSTIKEAIKNAQKVAEDFLNDFHREIEVHVVDTNDHIVW